MLTACLICWMVWQLASHEARVEALESKERYQVLKEDFDGLQNSYDMYQKKTRSDKAFMDQEILEKNDLIDLLYAKQEKEAYGQNPIDIFFSEHLLSSYDSPSLLTRDYIYMNLWEKELDHAYQNLKDHVGEYFISYLDQSLINVKALRESEGHVALASMHIESGLGHDNFDYRAMDRATLAWEGAEIFKTQTLKIHQYLDLAGLATTYVFDGDALLKTSEDLFVEDDFFRPYYTIKADGDNEILDLYDGQGQAIKTLSPMKDIQVSPQSHDQLVIEGVDENMVDRLYIYTLSSSQVDPYLDPLYRDRNYLVYMEDGALVVAFVSDRFRDDLILERAWSPKIPLREAIVSIMVVDKTMMKVTYLMGEDNKEIVEYIKLK